MSRVLVISEDPTVTECVTGTGRQNSLEVRQTSWSDWEVQTLRERAADVLLFDYRNPDVIPGEATLRLADELRRPDLAAHVVLVAPFAQLFQEAVEAAIDRRNISLANPHVLADAEAFEQIVAKLVAYHDLGKQDSRFQRNVAESTRAFPYLVAELHNPKTGRLDARRVGELFAIPLKRLAAALGAESAAVYKTPDAAGLQEGLRLYERIARVLLPLVGSEEGLRIWLNTPEPDLDNEIPRDLLLGGEGEVVAELLEDMREGQPG